MAEQQEQTYIQLNLECLRKEFPNVPVSVVKDVYFQSDKDCEEARRLLRERMPASGRNKKDDPQVGQVLSSNDSAHPEPTLLVEQFGDLFTLCNATDSLCHCVSRDLRMGKGIAVQFKQRFGNVPQLVAQKAAIGTAAILQRPGSDTKNTAFVYYLITKERYFHKPTLESVRQSCEWMRHHASIHNVRVIAMPRIACGLDGLQWPHVKRHVARRLY